MIKDIFRKYPNKYESIIGALCENLDTLVRACACVRETAALLYVPRDRTSRRQRQV